MSDIAARRLVRHGYTNLWNLEGGMVAWRQRGYPRCPRRRNSPDGAAASPQDSDRIFPLTSIPGPG